MNSMKTATRNVVKVELYNLWIKGARFPRNGYYAALYEPTPGVGCGFRRLRTLRDFQGDEQGARAYAELWNGPEIGVDTLAAE